jgi:hypothetical protein
MIGYLFPFLFSVSLKPPPIFVNREDTRRHAKKIIQKTLNKKFLEVQKPFYKHPPPPPPPEANLMVNLGLDSWLTFKRINFIVST